MKLICLCENTTHNPALQAEHGLSVYIETGNKKILLDFGQTDVLLSNAQALGVDLSLVDMAVLSHGHYDHGGGLNAFLSVNSTAKVYLHENAFGDFYDSLEKYIGLDPALKGHPQLCPVVGDTLLGEGIALRMPKPSLVVPLRHGGLTQKVGETVVPDQFSHELYLEIQEGEKRVLFSGCAHKGIENIMAWFSPDVFVGGMHLFHFPLDSHLETLGQTLNQYDSEYITCHCTGQEQFDYLKEKGCHLLYLSCGKTLT